MTKLTTPAGRPEATALSNRAIAESGVCSAGLSTCVQPTAIAGAIFFASIAIGKFHGVMAAATPIGRR